MEEWQETNNHEKDAAIKMEVIKGRSSVHHDSLLLQLDGFVQKRAAVGMIAEMGKNFETFLRN